MKILKKDLKAGSIALKVETLDDLWHLERILEPKDLVTSKTMRKVVVKRGSEVEYGDKKPVVLTLKTEKIEFQESGVLRITGPITSGPDDIQLNSYHTIQVEPGSVITIQKEWKSYHLDRLNKAQIKQPLLLICVLDREEADLALLKESGIEKLGSVRSRDPENREEYYKNILSFLEKQIGYQKIIIAGPGFERENLLNFIKKMRSKISESVVLEHCSTTGMHGIQEVLKSSANRILTDTRISKESRIVEEVLGRIKTEGLVVYGPEETKKAVEMGAVETLLVSDKRVREFEELMEKVEKLKGNVVIIGSDHESGEQFFHLGGIAAFLRFRLS